MYNPTKTDYQKAKSIVADNGRKHTALERQMRRATGRANRELYISTINSIDCLWRLYYDAKETILQFEKPAEPVYGRINDYERRRNTARYERDLGER